jgi:hypothetical protein
MCARVGERRSASARLGDHESRYGRDPARTRPSADSGQSVGEWIVDDDDHPTGWRIADDDDHPTGRRAADDNDHPTARRAADDSDLTAGRYLDDHVNDDGQPALWRFVGKRVGGWVVGAGFGGRVVGGGGQSVVWSFVGKRVGGWVVGGGSHPGEWVICA